MTQTAYSYTAGKGSFEIQITAALDTAVSAIAAGDVGEWVDVSSVLQNRESSARQRETSEEYVTGSTDPILTVADQIGAQEHTLTVLDTDGAAEDYGLAGSINVYDDILLPAFINKLSLPIRYTDKGNTTGNKLYTHTGSYITSLGFVPVEAATTTLAKRQVTFRTSDTPTESTVA